MVVEKKRKTSKGWWVIIITLLALHFIQLPYYYTEPGDALELSPYIEVDGGYRDESGSLMLTTVKMSRTNPYLYAWAHLGEYRELIPDEYVKRPEETDEEYFHRQQMVMGASQDHAKIVAYQKAGQDVTIDYRGIRITALIEGMPAHEVLMRDDRIIAVDGEVVQTVQQLNAKTANKGAGDVVVLSINREGKTIDFDVPLSPFPEHIEGAEDRVGLGILHPITDRVVTYKPEATIDVRKIGGPSAGLMFALEVYNQLIPEDITKGYQIAGTGEINEEGIVGRIGGVSQKVVAAHRKGADIFFVPNEGDRENSNYRVALETAEVLGTNLQVVGVETFDDAIRYLEGLEIKR